MPVEERRRSALRRQITTARGEEAADTLFELITPAGHEPATKQDIDRFLERVDLRFEELGHQVERRVGDAITTQTRTLVVSQLAALVAIAALAFGLQ